MTRQINLNTQHLLPGFGPVQLPLFLLVLLLAITASAGWVFWSWSVRQNYLAEEDKWRVALDLEIQTLNEFQAEYPNINNEPELVTINESLTTQLEKARETYSGLANQVENAIEGFNEPLIQLANYDLNGLWLNKIALKDGKRYFALDGVARNPELIPAYLEQLGESNFRGITIEQLSVAKEEDANLWRFTLSNGQAETMQEAE